MLMSRALSRVSRSAGARSLLLSATKSLQMPSFSTQFHSLICDYPNKVITNDEHESTVENNGEDPAKASGITNPGETEVTKESALNTESQNTVPQSEKGKRRATKRTAFSDSDSESDGDLSMVEMVKLVEEKEELLNTKQKEIEQMKDKVVRTLAEMENVIARTRREAENSKKFAIQVVLANQ
ncbi:grpE protein homolog 2, mitochondrial-like [Hibiscus syriacus]|uniref:grpE protein homolog 2, mitochondrial-like n=1 Tax=Hibiscus syriacus TaxID=106335 RepID=UPI00192093E3|nr:grpE protein homolog 2, mitochondrial-like [Hibiscus syriacus]